jgi:NADPH:quinone reductase-like Zn-dependent oxidoreductase
VLKQAEVEKLWWKDDEVLIRVHATSVTIGDLRMRAFDVPLWNGCRCGYTGGGRRPKRAMLGMEWAGKVDTIGKDVRRFMYGIVEAHWHVERGHKRGNVVLRVG